MSSSRILLLVAIGLSLGACAASGVNVRPYESQVGSAPMTAFDSAYSAGKNYYEKHRLGLAIVTFEKALSIDPRSVAALNAIGAAYDDLNRCDIAMIYYKKALKIEPQSADTYNNMGVSLLLANRRAEAEDMLRQAARLDPKNQMVAANLARIARQVRTLSELMPVDEDDHDRPRIERSGEDRYALYVPDGSTVPLPGTVRTAPSERRAAASRESVLVEPLTPPKA